MENDYGNANIEKPTLLLDKKRVRRNILKMVDKAARNKVNLRPHFKTHQSAEVGAWFCDQGVKAITVSSVDMATYFAELGWRDITIAFPVNLRQLPSIDRLANRISLGLLLEAEEAVFKLDAALSTSVGAWIKIDVGYGRTGIHWQKNDEIIELARSINQSRNLKLSGILTHAGHTYAAESPAQISAIYYEALRRLETIRSDLKDEGFSALISVGDTPACSVVEDLGSVDEIRPGNFVFYDLSQLAHGSCTEDEIAVGVACPVVAKHSDRHQIVVYGGAIHLSKEPLIVDDDLIIFGRPCLLTVDGWSPAFGQSYVCSLSQEHGVVQAEPELFEAVEVGDLLVILPVHSCLTANLLGRYLSLDSQWITMARL